MNARRINPWDWQDALGFSQAVEISRGARVLLCAGQAAMSAQGRPAHPGDMRAQIALALDNLEEVLRRAGYAWSQVVRLDYYTTDVDRFFEAYDVLLSRLRAAGCQPASTLLGVHRLAFPELMVEITATAVA